MNWLQAIVSILQTIVVIGGFIYTIRSIRQSNDARNVDFIIQAEGQVDPLFIALIDESPVIIRKVLPNLVPPEVTDETMVKAYVYTYFAYRHLSRITYLLSNNSVSLGMSNQERRDVLDTWINEVRKYNQEILKNIHSYSRQTGEFNETFTTIMDEVYEKPVAEPETTSSELPAG
jgi:hypothetical protein